MKAGIITIGDELLIGQTINTNLAWIGKSLSEVGVSIYQSATIRDDENAIIETLDYFLGKVDLIIITGGLGPTNDDITKETLTKYFNTELVLNQEALDHVHVVFAAAGKEVLASNIQQAMVPKNARTLFNTFGTAPGMWFEKRNKNIISLPGVPYEMKAMFSEQLLPQLESKFDLKGKYYQTIMIQGIEESFLANKIEDWENRLYKDELHLAYLPSPGVIRLRITTENGSGEADKINSYFTELRERLPQYVYGKNEESIFQTVGEMLKTNKATLGTIESCTGGGIAKSFIGFSGASTFFSGSLITYTNDLKKKLANVSMETLNQFGAVSKEVAEEMAIGGKKQLGVDYTIAVTGIAGPDGGTKEKPVGTVWMAIATPEKVVSKRFLFGENRERNLTKTEMSAANFLRNVLLEIKF